MPNTECPVALSRLRTKLKEAIELDLQLNKLVGKVLSVYILSSGAYPRGGRKRGRKRKK